MIPAEFDTQFNRLTNHFHLPNDADRDQVALDWLKAVEHYHVDALERGVTDLIRNATDRFWPPLGKLLEAIRGRMAGMEKTPGKCATCHGSTWIEAWPMKSRDGRVYEFMSRCPDCGVPAPTMNNRHDHLMPLSQAEYQQFKAGEWNHPPMPEGLQAKPRKPGEVTEIAAAMERLRVKLFGGAERRAS